MKQVFLPAITGFAFVFGTSFLLAAEAQSAKHDILGFYMGMAKAEFINNIKVQSLDGCAWKSAEWKKDAEGAIPINIARSIVGRCSNGKFLATFTESLKPNVLTKIVYAFETQKTPDAIEADVLRQFGLNKRDSYNEFGGVVFDFPEHVKMSFRKTNLMAYEVVFETERFRGEDQAAGEIERNRTAPQIKF